MARDAAIAHNIRHLYEYRDEALNCIRCGMCRMVHPDFVSDNKYSENCPRGLKNHFEAYYGGSGTHSIVRALTAKDPYLEYDDPEVLDIIFSCSVCGSCQQNCNPIKHLEPANEMMALREWIIRKGILLKQHNALIQSIINYDNPWMAPRRTRGKWARDLKREKGIEVKDASKEQVEILCFAGCNGGYVPEITPVVKAMGRVLDLAGVSWGILGDKERCCGSTAFRVGAVDMFEEYKKKNIEQLNSLGIKKLVTVCAGCYSTFKHNYAADLDFEVVHLSELMEDMIKNGDLKFKKPLDMRVTYHDPCHLGRYGGIEDGIFDPPREILKALPGVEFVEMNRIRHYSYCCGSGGGVKAAHPEVAAGAAMQRWEEAMEVAGTKIMTTCCPFCEINLGEQARQIEGAQMLDVMQLVDKALGD